MPDALVEAVDKDLLRNPIFDGLPHAVIDFANQPKELGSWKLEAKETDISQIAVVLTDTITMDSTTHHRLKPAAIEDLMIVCHYSVTE